MTPLGWIFMLVSVGGVWLLTGYCYFRILTAPAPLPEEPQHFHSA